MISIENISATNKIESLYSVNQTLKSSKYLDNLDDFNKNVSGVDNRSANSIWTANSKTSTSNSKESKKTSFNLLTETETTKKNSFISELINKNQEKITANLKNRELYSNKKTIMAYTTLNKISTVQPQLFNLYA
jgi:hypothetical protein